MKSIMQENWDECFLCGRNRLADPCGLEEHHVFGGANRKFSERYGLKVHICGNRCHRNGAEAIHRNKMVNLSIKIAAQKVFEDVHGSREEFRNIFGKNYL